jgi:putative aminopeptidase FrvX
MDETTKVLKGLVQIPGISGHEKPVREHLKTLWEPLTDELSESRLGSLHGLRRATKGAGNNSILIATHMDQIGLMVTEIQAGLLRVTGIGGVDQRTLPGLAVAVHTQNGELPGVVALPPAHTLPEDVAKKGVPVNYLWVDTGLPEKQVLEMVQLGDLISFSLPPRDLSEGYLTAPGLDNRASVTALTESLKILKTRQFSWDVWATATVQEEVSLWGAQTSGFSLRPSLAVVVDVNFASGPGSPSHETFEMDKGPTFDFGPTTHPRLYEEFEKVAKQHEIPYQRCVYPRSSGTDAETLQLVAEGIPTMIVGIPIRYMHTPVEMVQIKDIQRVARLLAVFIESLDDEFMARLKWDVESEAGV